MDKTFAEFVTCEYNGKTIAGTVEYRREIPGQGMLVVVKVDGGFKSFYLDKATNVSFF